MVRVSKLEPSTQFQSTLSLRRATIWIGELGPDLEKFQSTLSLRRATVVREHLRELIAISIHALLAESDKSIQDNVLPNHVFQSTLSLRRATANTTKLALSFLSKVPI